MPKISRKHYRNVKSDTDLSVDFVKSKQGTSSASTSVTTAQHASSSCSDERPASSSCSDERPLPENNDESDDDFVDDIGSSHSNFDTDVSLDISDSAQTINVLNISNDNFQPNNIAQGINNFSSHLVEWAIKHKITHVALNDLLKILNLEHIADLPSDARTLLRTPRKVHVKVVEPGRYCHFGLINCIEKLLLAHDSFSNLESIEVYINIDGLPLSKSSNSQLYPILCNLVQNSNVVDIVGIYHGNEKPKDANMFLKDFVDEATDLTTHGVSVKGSTYPFKIKGFICDAPAKSFITYTKGHSGYYSCTKCNVEGTYINNRVCFPNSENSTLRNDNDFRSKLQEDHHTGTSIIESIPSVNMVSDFPLDPMHLLYLGVVKKLIVALWVNGKPPGKLSFTKISQISDLLIHQRRHIPCEFSRKPRTLNECKRWKATEFRQFLFYTGPVVLKSVLSRDKYVNFLTLHVAATILSCSKYAEHLNYATSLLKYFVRTFITLYGRENVSHNVHNLLHICSDSEKFGTLEEFSAFPFENYMQAIKKLLRKHDKPLEQIIRRKSEQDSCADSKNKMQLNDAPRLLNEHARGPLVTLSNFTQFQKVVFSKFTLKILEPDNCCCLNDGSIIFIRNFALNDAGTFVIGNKFMSVEDFYTEPCSSSEFGIHIVDNFGVLQSWNLNEIAYKCLKLEFKNKSVIFPLLHLD